MLQRMQCFSTQREALQARAIMPGARADMRQLYGSLREDRRDGNTQQETQGQVERLPGGPVALGGKHDGDETS